MMLGISPGTRKIGFAVHDNSSLIRAGTMYFKQRWSAQKLAHIKGSILKLVDHYEIKTIVVKRVDPLRSSPELKRLIASLHHIGNAHGRKLIEYPLNTLKQFCGAMQGKGSAIFADYVNATFPDYREECHKENLNRNPYYYKMFEAMVAIEVARKRRGFLK